MNAKIWIRIAAALMLLHTIGHSFGTFSKASPNQKITQITNEMAQNHFVFMGRDASLAIFFEGYGVSLIMYLFLSALLLWIVSTSTDSELGRKLVVISMVSLIVLTVIEIIYCFPFFLTPVAAVCTIVAYLKIKTPNTIAI